MIEGTLIYNEEEERPDIQKDNGELYGGLHCGDCFRYEDTEDVRLEYNHDTGEWYTMENGKPQQIRYNRRVII